MTSVNKPLGRITLRDFKTVFDRPGFYRYHIKNTDTEYGMVKEEVSTDFSTFFEEKSFFFLNQCFK
jgi:DIX domain